MNKAVEMRNEKLGKTVVKALQSRHFEAYYVNNREEALKKALDLIPEGDTVSWGGSATINEIGLTQKLHEGNYKVLDRDKPAPGQDIPRMALTCDTFITSSNAISEDGQLVNIDGTGNRVAAMIFGPKNVVVVAGINKVVSTVDDAMTRARTVAAPMNCQRFENLKTTCNVTGACGDCKGEDSICAYLVTTRVCRPKGKIKVILVGESLGY